MNEVIGYVVKFADNTYYATSKVDPTHHTDKLRKAKIFKSRKLALVHGWDHSVDKNNEDRKVIKVVIKEIEED